MDCMTENEFLEYGETGDILLFEYIKIFLF